MKEIKVLHAPSEIAGLSITMVKALQKLGVHANSLSLVPNRFQYEGDIKVDLRELNRFQRGLIILFQLMSSLFKFNIYHFHYGRSFFPGRIDVPFLKLLGKKVFVHFHGSDVRNLQIIHQTREHYIGERKRGNTAVPLSTTEQQQLISFWRKFSDSCIVSTPDLLAIVPEARWIPQAIDLEKWPYHRKSAPDGVITIVHVPSKRKLKGTEFIIKAIDELSDRGYKIQFLLVEGMRHREVKAIYREADIVIDQLLIGSYGVVSVEAMATGRPVICYISDTVRNIYPDNIPIVSATPDTLMNELEKLINSQDLRMELGKAGRNYVEEYHDAVPIAENLIGLYQSSMSS